MKVLDLFSGIGGFSLGLERAGMETVAFCEYDEKCRQVLRKHWPDVPRYHDVRTLTGEQLERDGIRDIGLICGGYPCQPFSTAGKREGKADDRHLWPEMFRLIQELRPAWVLGENVAGHISMGIDDVLANLESEGYACQTFIIPAVSVGAPHRRDRAWIVANTEHGSRRGPGHGQDCQQRNSTIRTPNPDVFENSSIGPKALANSQSQRCGETGADSERPEKRATGGSAAPNPFIKHGDGRRYGTSQICGEFTKSPEVFRSEHWDIEPDVGRVANGVPGRVDRLKQLGNAVVPQIPEIIGRAIMESA